MCNEKDRRLHPLPAPLVLLLVMALSGVARAESDTDLSYTPRTVQQMLEIDSRLALQKEQQREREAMGLKGLPAAPSPAQPTVATAPLLPQMAPLATPAKAISDTADAPKPPKPIAVKLEGIFGIGDRLFADVLIDGRRVRFQRGHRYPLGYERGFEYGLIAINVPCVRLTGSQGTQTLCIRPFGD